MNEDPDIVHLALKTKQATLIKFIIFQYILHKVNYTIGRESLRSSGYIINVNT